MKRNHVRWLTAVITTALLLLGAGLPAKAQFVVSDPAILAKTIEQSLQDLKQYKKEAEELLATYGKIRDFSKGLKQVKDAGKALKDISRLPDIVLRKYRNNKYLYDFEKLSCFDALSLTLSEATDVLSEIGNYGRYTPSKDDGRPNLTAESKLMMIDRLCDEVIALRNQAYRIVYKYDRISEYRAKEAGTQRLFDKLNGYK
ncbi:hypothetical protein [Porphyromonas uenonis]|uniref:hypothetical protein n=1 Tax=Porphyromonas uenonis TaxID=281920 RepID=UPI00048267CA|nr:hypothetical protein [Porphyromonas uenonis]